MRLPAGRPGRPVRGGYAVPTICRTPQRWCEVALSRPVAGTRRQARDGPRPSSVGPENPAGQRPGLLVSAGPKVYNPADKHFRQRCLWRQQHDSADVSGDRCGRHAYRCRALRAGRHPGRGQGAHPPRRPALFRTRGTGRSGKGSGRKIRPRGPGAPAQRGACDRGHHPGRQRPGAGPGRSRGPGPERRTGTGARPLRHRGRRLHPARRSGPSRRGGDAAGCPSPGRRLRRLEKEGRAGRGLRGQVFAPQRRARAGHGRGGACRRARACLRAQPVRRAQFPAPHRHGLLQCRRGPHRGRLSDRRGAEPAGGGHPGPPAPAQGRRRRRPGGPGPAGTRAVGAVRPGGQRHGHPGPVPRRGGGCLFRAAGRGRHHHGRGPVRPGLAGGGPRRHERARPPDAGALAGLPVHRCGRGFPAARGRAGRGGPRAYGPPARRPGRGFRRHAPHAAGCPQRL